MAVIKIIFRGIDGNLMLLKSGDLVLTISSQKRTNLTSDDFWTAGSSCCEWIAFPQHSKY